MNKTQIKKVLSSIANIEINGRGENWEIETETENGYRKVSKALRAAGVSFGGFKCGHGGWVLTQSYRAEVMDYCNQASSAHY